VARYRSISSPTKEANWELDGLGNWATYLEKTGGTTTLDQDRTHNAVNEITDFTNNTGSAWTDPTHDAAGNITLAPSPTAPSNSAKNQTYIWDAWNRLVEVKEGGTSLAKFGYDGLNRRITKLVGSDTHHYYLSGQNQVLEEQLDTGVGGPTTVNQLVWHSHYVDALAARYDNNELYYSLYDANYNVTSIVDEGSYTYEHYFYTPYGQVTVLDASFANPSSSSSIGQENLYTGRQLDPETGLHYYRARYYHQTLGSFIGRDPINYAAGDFNLYRYVANSAVNFTDPSGMATCATTPAPGCSASACSNGCAKFEASCVATGVIGCIALGPAYFGCVAAVATGCTAVWSGCFLACQLCPKP
jgi:RHS repeat-associated protein